MTANQCRLILALLRQRPEGITPLEALNMVGSFRLAARIKDLRDQGFDIETVLETTPSGKRVARYRLHEVVAGQSSLWGAA